MKGPNKAYTKSKRVPISHPYFKACFYVNAKKFWSLIRFIYSKKKQKKQPDCKLQRRFWGNLQERHLFSTLSPPYWIDTILMFRALKIAEI